MVRRGIGRSHEALVLSSDESPKIWVAVGLSPMVHSLELDEPSKGLSPYIHHQLKIDRQEWSNAKSQTANCKLVRT